MSESLSIKELVVALGGEEVLHGIDLELPAGGYGVVLGPSGAGKSTMLRAVAGLVEAQGTIVIGSRTVCAGRQVIPAEARGIGFLFQGLALWPHMTVEGHLRYALKGGGIPRAEHGNRIAETLGPLGIAHLARRRPGELSGGERQRLGLARALVTRPGVLLLDEPTSSVDPAVARDVRDLLADLNRRFGTSVLHVTHDQQEALALAGRIFIMDGGRILQSGTPEDVYERPAGARVATFVGEGGLLPGTLDGNGTADTPLGRLPADAAGLDGPVWLLVRPEDVEEAPLGEGVPVQLERASYRAGGWHARVRAGDTLLTVLLSQRPDPDQPLRIRVVRPPRAVEARRKP